jgi:hypothetical protein
LEDMNATVEGAKLAKSAITQKLWNLVNLFP